MSKFDVIFIGGGSAGYVGAIRAAQLGLKPVVIEKDKLGGTCLHRGCIPSKAYLESAQIYTEFQHRETFGITAENIGYDFDAIQSFRQKMVDANWNGVKFLMKKNKIEVVEGTATIADTTHVQVTGKDGSTQTIEGDNLVVGVGTLPRTLGINVDGERIFTSDNVWDAREMPTSIIVLGGGVICCEFASFYNAFGVEVTIVEMMSAVLPMMDADASKEIARAFTKRGIKIMTDARALPETVQAGSDGVQMEVEVNGQRQSVKADYLLVSAAREAQTTTGAIGLDKIGVELDRGFVKIGTNQRTNVPNVYAIGDCCGGLALAHKAYADGILAAESIAGKNQLQSIDMNRVPQPVFSFPQVAAVGLTEAQARETGAEIEIGKFPYTANAKAKILDQTAGFAKVIADKKTGEILGVTLVGPSVTELISEAALGKFLESTPLEIAYNIHPHPTLSEALGEAAHGAEGEGPLHM